MKRSSQDKGFTLVEVLLAVAILSIGAVFLYQGNWMTLDVYGRYVRSLGAQNWAEEKIWKEKEKILESPAVEEGESSGAFSYNKRTYSWNLKVDSAGRSELLYSIELVVSWREGGRSVELKRFSFVRKPQVFPTVL